MTVCHLTSVHTLFDTRIFAKECRSIAEAGHTVHLVAGGAEDALVGGVVISGVRKDANRIARMLFTTRRVMRAALAIDADLYHIHDPELIPWALLLKARGKRVVYDIHEDYSSWLGFNDAIKPVFRAPAAWAFSILERFAARRFDALVTVTPRIAEKFARLNPRTVLVRNFPRREEFADVGAGSGGPDPEVNEVCYVGAVSPKRGLAEMIRAVVIAGGKTPVKLVVGGDLSPDAREIAASLTPEERGVVEFTGYLTRARIAEVFRRARIGLLVLHPERNYLVSYPTKLFEYMSAGLPVICSDFPVFRELDRGIGCCRFVDPLDPQAIADAVVDLLTHPGEAHEMGRRGRQAVEERYSWETEARTLLALYGDILSPTERRR
jgi:glycosyltransferase involved in cell wall biosynthesis